MWQELRTELHPQNLEIVTVALDTAGLERAGKFIERAKPEHPSLIDEAHVCDELFGIVNVPSGIWIDEAGTIVRPPEPAFPGRAVVSETLRAATLAEDIDPYLRGVIEEARKIRHEPAKYLAALRDWAASGAASRYVLPPDEVLRRSRPRPREEAEAAARFALGQHLWRAGHRDAAVGHFREAHRLQPGNWTYKRQAWSFVNPVQGPSEEYESDWLSDVRKIGAENYYPAVEM